MPCFDLLSTFYTFAIFTNAITVATRGAVVIRDFSIWSALWAIVFNPQMTNCRLRDLKENSVRALRFA
jgi:hypothetical protein